MNSLNAIGRQLDRLSPLGARWAGVVRAATPYVRTDASPWTVYDIDLGAGVIPRSLPNGAAIYAAMGGGAWQYAGKTISGVRGRLLSHAGDASPAGFGKRAYWSELVVIPLVSEIPLSALSALERDAKSLLNPRMGQRWG